VIAGLVDLDLDRLVDQWRDALPKALGEPV
jgi:hypothetical protein